MSDSASTCKFIQDSPDCRGVHITILAGLDKSGAPEGVEKLEFAPGDVVCVLGPTGSGKSRLLNDLETLANGDSPSGRVVLIDGAVPEETCRYQLSGRLVAQLSQNMNFVMDYPAEDFIVMHAQSRGCEDPQAMAAAVLACANELAGERFEPKTPLTSLSGGQSRALMVADVALLSESPVVLLDEVENAGIDKWAALDLLAKSGKIVLASTHDPVIALMGHRRVIVSNGGVTKVVQTSGRERENMRYLVGVDGELASIRQRLRRGDTVEEDLRDKFGRL